MNAPIQVRGSLIDPIYCQSHPDEPIDLGKVQLAFDCNGITYHETANVAMKFSPDCRLEFVCPLGSKPPTFGLELFHGNDRDNRLTLTDRGVTIDAFCKAAGKDFGGIVFMPKRSGVSVSPPSKAIFTAIFHLFNFPEFFGPEDYTITLGEPPFPGFKRCGRALLKADGWSITIAATDRTGGLSKELDAQGGYALTHMGRITRDDGSLFSSEQLSNLLGCLHYFLSFALGRWAGIALPIGFDTEGNRVFEEWGLGKTADGSWNGSCSWFDELHGELLSEVFPGFLSLWERKLWHVSLPRAVYWYLGACDRRVGIGTDTGLILAQTALELLAWTYCVQDRKIVSPTKFKPRGLSAADKLRLLASTLCVPVEIPPELSALHARKGKKWVDGMKAITSIRNSVVHPDVLEELPDHSYFEAWKLSLWLIDLVLLRLCGHKGNYANRLTMRWKGVVESVPWASIDAAKT